LRPEREFAKVGFESPQPSQDSGEIETGVNAQHPHTGLLDPTTRLWNRNGNRVAVEWNPTHDVTRPRVPGIVFPVCKDTARLEKGFDELERFGLLVWRDVVEDSVAKNEVCYLAGTVGIWSVKLDR
jgi:hypothetical protein